MKKFDNKIEAFNFDLYKKNKKLKNKTVETKIKKNKTKKFKKKASPIALEYKKNNGYKAINNGCKKNKN